METTKQETKGTTTRTPEPPDLLSSEALGLLHCRWRAQEARERSLAADHARERALWLEHAHSWDVAAERPELRWLAAAEARAFDGGL